VPKHLAIAASLLTVSMAPARAHAAERIKVALEVHVEGPSASDVAEAQLRNAVRRELEALGDVDVAPPGQAAGRVIRILGATASGFYAASVIVTERYDRQTLMVLGIEDDDLAATMMALHIVNGHWVFAGSDLADIAQRLVTSVNTGVLARSRQPAPQAR
jgi:hypothetical protein